MRICPKCHKRLGLLEGYTVDYKPGDIEEVCRVCFKKFENKTIKIGKDYPTPVHMKVEKNGIHGINGWLVLPTLYLFGMGFALFIMMLLQLFYIIFAEGVTYLWFSLLIIFAILFGFIVYLLVLEFQKKALFVPLIKAVMYGDFLSNVVFLGLDGTWVNWAICAVYLTLLVISISYFDKSHRVNNTFVNH